MMKKEIEISNLAFHDEMAAFPHHQDNPALPDESNVPGAPIKEYREDDSSAYIPAEVSEKYIG